MWLFNDRVTAEFVFAYISDMKEFIYILATNGYKIYAKQIRSEKNEYPWHVFVETNASGIVPEKSITENKDALH